MWRFRKIVIIVVLLYADVAILFSPSFRKSSEYLFKEDPSKIKFSIAPNNDYSRFAFVYCKNVTYGMTEMNCTIIVEYNVYDDETRQFARICNVTINSKADYHMGYYKHKINMLDNDKVILSHEDESSNCTDYLNASRAVSIRIVNMKNCQSTGSDIAVEFSMRMLPQPDYFIVPFQGTLKVITHAKDSPCNWTYCIFTYDETGNRIGDVIPVLQHSSDYTGLLVDLKFSTGSMLGNHVAIFTDQSDRTERLFYVEPINNTVRTIRVNEKASKKLFYDVISSIMDNDTILVCLDSDQSIDCKQWDQCFNLKMNATLWKNYTNSIFKSSFRLRKRSAYPGYRNYHVPHPRTQSLHTYELMEVKNLKDGDGFLILTTNRETNRLSKIYRNGRRLSYFDTKRCYGESHIYADDSQLCYFALCENFNKGFSRSFVYQMSVKCAENV